MNLVDRSNARPLRTLALALAVAVTGCGFVQVRTSGGAPPSGSSAEPAPSVGRTATESASAAAPPPSPTEAAKERLASLEREGLERLVPDRVRYPGDLFPDLELENRARATITAKEVRVDEMIAPYKERLRAAAANLVKSEAEKDNGWADTTPAPKDAEKAALDELRRNSNFAVYAKEVTLLGVRVTDKDWQIEKTHGYPLAKFKRVLIVAKRNGVENCVAFYGTINHQHEGGGIYSTSYGSVSDPIWHGVKCLK